MKDNSKDSISVPHNYKLHGTEQDTKQDIKKEANQEIKSETPATLVIKTEIDAYINEILQTQPKSLDEVEVADVHDYSVNRVALPKDIEQCFKNKGLAPRWINKDKRMIDRAIHIRGWLIVNRVYFPEIKKYHFTANGTIENGDSILGFMPAERAERLRKAPGEISQERIKNLPIEKYKGEQGEKIGYYKPALTPEKDGEMETVGIQPDKPSTEE